MRTLRIAALVGAVGLGGPALAAEKPKTPVAGQYVDISPIAVPIVVGGRLVNYVFVTVRLNLTPRADAIRLRDKEPYFRDALVRDAHRHPFVDPKNYTRIDEGALKTALMADAQRIIGAPGLVAGVQIMAATPKQVSGLPKPAAAPPTGRAIVP